MLSLLARASTSRLDAHAEVRPLTIAIERTRPCASMTFVEIHRAHVRAAMPGYMKSILRMTLQMGNDGEHFRWLRVRFSLERTNQAVRRCARFISAPLHAGPNNASLQERSN